jgi:hypothetical protein
MKTRRLRWAFAFAVLAFAMLFAVRRVRRDAAVSLACDLASYAKVPAIVRALRPNYPYSVVPGGIYSGKELRRSIENDPAVGRHYAGFDPEKARLLVAQVDSFEYASYRVRGQIFWTGRKLRIPKGEVLIGDGVHLARTRCGNRLSAVPVPHTSGQEPGTEELSLPQFSMDLLKRGLVTLAAPPMSDSAELSPPVLTTDLETGPGQSWPPAASGFGPNLALPQLHSPGSPGFGAVSDFSPPFGASLTPGIPVAKNRPPSSSTTTPSSPAPPTEIIGGVAEIPEPRALGIFTLFLFLSAWALARLKRTVPMSLDPVGGPLPQTDAVPLGEREESGKTR